MNEREDLRDFEERSKLPAVATREALENQGARYLRTDTFELNGGTRAQYQQMQLQKQDTEGTWMYMWKRLGPERDIDQRNFEIHLEVLPNGHKRYATSYCKQETKKSE